MERKISSIKLNIIEILYTELTHKEIKSALAFIIKKIMINDFFFSKYIKHIDYISETICLLVNSLLLYKCNSTIEELIFNYMKIYTDNSYLPVSSKRTKLLLYIASNFVIKTTNHFYFNNSYKKYYTDLNTIFKFCFLFKQSCVYSNILDYVFGIMLVNKGTNNNSLKLIFFLLYLLLKYGQNVYKTKTEDKLDKVINPPPKKCLKEEMNKCWYCKGKIIEPTIMKCCGFAYCYKCALKNCLYHKKCYSCGFEISNKYLIKLYGLK